MAISSVYTPRPPQDWRTRLGEMRGTPRGDADPRMVTQPYVDPGYAMPNANQGNLNQSPGQEIGGWLPAGGQNALMQPGMFQPVAMQDHDVNRQPETGFLPHYGYIPTEPPPGTYTGDIPTPPSDYGPTGLSLPHDWQRMNKLMQPGDPASWQLLLKTMLVNRHNRRA